MKRALISIILALSMLSTCAFADGETAETTGVENTTEVVETVAEEAPAEEATVAESDEVTPEPSQASTSTSFTDIDASHWAYSAIIALAERNVINGMGDGTFEPSGTVTREQFIKLLIAAYGYGGEQDAVIMPNDVDSSSWSYAYVRAAIIRKIVKDDTLSDGLFLPKENITRAVAVNWLANSINATPEKSCPFPDIKDDTTAKAASVCAEKGLIAGYEDYSFRPSQTLTRAEAAVIIARLMGLSDMVAYPEHSSLYQVSFTAVDNRNNWAVDGTNINIRQNNQTVAFGTTDTDGKYSAYLANGEYNILATQQGYETINLTITVAGKNDGYKFNLVPLTKSEFNNIYPSMTQDEQDAFVYAINYDYLWSVTPDEYDYRTDYLKVLENTLNAAPFISYIGFSEDVSAKKNDATQVSVKSLAERVDMYLLYHYGLAPNHKATDSGISLKYSDGYWYYNRASASTKSDQSITPEALYTSDNQFFYLKYSRDSSPDTKYAILYRTATDSYQILWASNTKLDEDKLTEFMSEAKSKFPVALPSSDTRDIVINVKDPSNGYSIDSVTIKIYDCTMKKVNEGIADVNGDHAVTLGIGSYIVKASHPDYADTYSSIIIGKDTKYATVTMTKK